MSAAGGAFGDNGLVSRQISVRDEIYDSAARIAIEQHVTVEDVIATAVSDQLAARAWIARRAQRSNEALDQASDVAPPERD